MTVREMTMDDIPGAVKVDSDAFSDPWGDTAFLEELTKDYSYYFVCEYNGEIAGYAGIWCIYETAELIRIGVSKKFRRLGIGNKLMEQILATSKSHGCERMMLEVRESNIAAQALYKKFGFCGISQRKGYYKGENALIMELKY